MTWVYAHNCTLGEYLDRMPDDQLRDFYAQHLGYIVCPGLEPRYQQVVNGGIASLHSLPSRDEMIAEIVGEVDHA